MIYKAKITKVPSDKNNEFKVLIYSFGDNTTNLPEFTAILSSDPGVYNGYAVGDTVLVSEVENGITMSLFVILGKLYTGNTSDANTYISANSLKVSNNVDLPESTTIAGWGAKNFFSFAQKISNLEGRDLDLSYVKTGKIN